MRVIIVGAGEVGFHTAERLSLEGHEVVVYFIHGQEAVAPCRKMQCANIANCHWVGAALVAGRAVG